MPPITSPTISVTEGPWRGDGATSRAVPHTLFDSEISETVFPESTVIVTAQEPSAATQVSERFVWRPCGRPATENESVCATPVGPETFTRTMKAPAFDVPR